MGGFQLAQRAQLPLPNCVVVAAVSRPGGEKHESVPGVLDQIDVGRAAGGSDCGRLARGAERVEAQRLDVEAQRLDVRLNASTSRIFLTTLASIMVAITRIWP